MDKGADDTTTAITLDRNTAQRALILLEAFDRHRHEIRPEHDGQFCMTCETIQSVKKAIWASCADTPKPCTDCGEDSKGF